MKIVVVGSLNIDTTYSLSHIPKEGETILAKNKTTQRGGKGQNQAIQMARLGAEISMIGAVGNDSEGENLIKGLEEENINASGIIIKDGPSGTASIYVDEKGQNNIVVYSGSNFKITKEDINEKIELIKNADICVMQNEIPLEIIYYVLEICKENNITVIHNPAPAVKNFDKKYLSYIDYFIPNETELELTLGKELGENVEDLAREVLKFGCKNVIVTLGSKGSLLVSEDKVYMQEAKKVKPIDTTAAGDSYIGGLSTALSKGKTIEESMEYGTITSSMTIQKSGAVDSLPRKEEVDENL